MDAKTDRSLRFAVCGADMLDELCAMQDEAFAALSDTALLRRNTREMLYECLLEPHTTLGAFDGDILAAFGVLWRGGQGSENLGATMGFSGAALEHIYNVKLIIVRPCYRGMGLQRELLQRIENIARKDGCRTLCATVAPGNVHSLRNFLSEGYTVYGTFTKYGRLERSLLYKDMI